MKTLRRDRFTVVDIVGQLQASLECSSYFEATTAQENQVRAVLEEDQGMQLQFQGCLSFMHDRWIKL